MKIKTSELTGAALDWAVQEAQLNTLKQPELGLLINQIGYGETVKRYSTNWSQGGPIIERESIDVRAPRPMWLYWKAYSSEWNQFGLIENNTQYGDTLLIAAMRCYVQSKLGDEVEIPDELF